MSQPLISIIIPALNEAKYIEDCLESILDSSYDIGRLEVFVVDGMSEDKTPALTEQYHKKYPFIKLIRNTQKITPIGMNLGIKASTGEYIFILSAHATYDKDYFIKLVQNCQVLHADCVGGVLRTDVKNKDKKSSSIKEVLKHKFGVGNATFRTGSLEVKEVDTVAFGCYRRSSLDTFGLFNERLIRNQDIELNKRIVNGGGKIYLIPEVECTYYARENFTLLAKNQYQNGFWNVLTAFYTKMISSLSLRHFIPLFFVVSLVLPLVLSVFSIKILWIAFLSLISYLSLVIIISLRLKNNSNSVKYLIVSFLTLHFAYGLGSLAGVFAVFKKIYKGKT